MASTPAAGAGHAGGRVRAQVAATQVRDVLSLLLLFRFANALCVRTFFQPDEYFQALEPAWSIAFGRASGAWLTWVSKPLSSLAPLATYLPREVGMAREVGTEVARPTHADHTVHGANTHAHRNGSTSSGRRSIPPSSAWPTRPSTVP